jgi:hypothetical protein
MAFSGLDPEGETYKRLAEARFDIGGRREPKEALPGVDDPLERGAHICGFCGGDLERDADGHGCGQ